MEINSFNLPKHLNKLIKYTIYIFALTLPFQTRLIITPGQLNNSYLEYNTISLYLSDILAILIILVITSLLIFTKNTHPLNKTTNTPLLLAGLEITILVSILTSPNIILSTYKYGLFIVGISLYLILTKFNYSKTKFTFFFLTGILFQSILALYQFFTQSSFQNKWLGLATHNPTILGTSVIETISGERWLRAYGSLDHPNMLGTFLSIGLLLLIIKTTHQKNKTTIQTLTPHTFITSISFLIIASALLTTFSRAAILGTIIALIYLITLLLLQKKHKTLLSAIKLFTAPTIIILIIVSLNQNIFLSRFNQTTRLEEKSLNERTTSYSQSLDIIKKKPLLGSGIGNYSNNLSLTAPNNPSWYYQPVHNTFLLIWTEIGIFGLLLFTLLLFNTFKKNIKKPEVIILFPILTTLLFDHWLWSLHFGILLFWVTLAIIKSRLITHKNK